MTALYCSLYIQESWNHPPPDHHLDERAKMLCGGDRDGTERGPPPVAGRSDNEEYNPIDVEGGAHFTPPASPPGISLTSH